MKEIGLKLKAARENMNVSIEEVAEDLIVALAAFSRPIQFSIGMSEPPSANNALAIRATNSMCGFMFHFTLSVSVAQTENIPRYRQGRSRMCHRFA